MKEIVAQRKLRVAQNARSTQKVACHAELRMEPVVTDGDPLMR